MWVDGGGLTNKGGGQGDSKGGPTSQPGGQPRPSVGSSNASLQIAGPQSRTKHTPSPAQGFVPVHWYASSDSSRSRVRISSTMSR